MIEVVTQQMSNGKKEISFEWGQRAPGVRLVAINKEGKILLTKEHRYELDDYDYRLPGGKVADSLEDWHTLVNQGTVLSAAKAKAIVEAKEEAGLIVNSINPIEIVPDGTTFKWDLHYFETRDFTLGEQELEHGEDIATGWYSNEEVLDLVKQKKISEGRSVYILMPIILT
jgi:8-oxo-dGTP pyrophosphatase MutT (NUDIX family)